MDRSPSPHHLESLNQEDKAASTAGEGAKGTVEAPPPTSLLDLPDELFVNVFDQVWQLLRPADNNSCIGILVPLSQILVNKRIFSLAHPLWFRHFTTPTDHIKLDQFLTNLLERPNLYPLIHSLCTEHSWHFPFFQSTTIGRLSNLSSLVISFGCTEGDNDPTEWIPVELTDALKKLKKLRHLRVTASPGVVDESFSLTLDLPTVRHMDVEGVKFLDAIMLDGGSRLCTLTLRTESPGEVTIFWPTLEILRLAPDEGFIEQPDDLVKAFRMSLKRLILDFPSTKKSRPSHQFQPAHLRSMLDILQRSPLERLELSRVDALDWEDSEIRLPSVKVLVLRGTLRVHKENHLVALQSFLAMFPELNHLIVEGFTFSKQNGQTATAFSALSPVSLAVRHPAFSSLLVVLGASSVCDFRFRTWGEKQELRYTRSRREDRFEAEGWLLE